MGSWRLRYNTSSIEAFESISSIEASLALLKKYQQILHRETLRADLDAKFMIIFHNYGLELA